MLVLDGNNPRFPWEPSIVMLNSGSLALQRLRRPTGPDATFWPLEQVGATAATAERVTQSSPTLARTEGALRC